MRILVVDDTSLALNRLTNMINDLGFQSIDQARDGANAFKQITEFRRPGYYDVILLDINMPKMNGLEFLEKIKDHPAKGDARVVMTTAEREKTLIAKALQLGASGYITKPVTSEDLQEVLTKIQKAIDAEKPA